MGDLSADDLRVGTTMRCAHTSPLAIGPPAPEVFVPPARRVAVCAPWIRSDGHALAGVETWAKPTFEPDHSAGADQIRHLAVETADSDGPPDAISAASWLYSSTK